MKRQLAALLTVLMLLSLCVTVSATDIVMPYEVDRTLGGFIIDSSGIAQIDYGCIGDSTTESIRVTVKLEKRTLLLFWKDVETWTVNVNGTSVSDYLTYQLTDGGTYRCTITYEVTSSDGTVETDEYQAKAEYNPA